MRVMLDVIHEGDAVRRYDGKCVEIDTGDRGLGEAMDEIEAALDGWRATNLDRCDEFGSAERSLAIEEVCEILPEWAKAKVVPTPIRTVFI